MSSRRPYLDSRSQISPNCVDGTWDRIAHAWAELMRRLNYSHYVEQGGDWGAWVTTRLAQQHPAGLLGIHLNLPLVIPNQIPVTGLSPFPHEGFRLFRGASNTPADDRLRTERLSGGAGRMDLRAVSPSHRSCVAAIARSNAGRHHALLADQHGRLFCANLLRR
jgi:pimeloyl-ACP methyl ester carboxylesterase